jgi:hypothetical protein
VREGQARQAHRREHHRLESSPGRRVVHVLDRPGERRARVVHEPEWPFAVDHSSAGLCVRHVEQRDADVDASIPSGVSDDTSLGL